MPCRIVRACVAVLITGTACAPRTPSLPPASFLIAAGDSTFWVEQVDDGFITRRSPLLLTRVDGRFHELYVVDRDFSFSEALLVGQAIYRRDLISGDSSLVHDDGRIAQVAAAWVRRHPGAEPLAPDEETVEDPPVQATTEHELLDVVGPYLMVEAHADIDAEGEPHEHLTRRLTLDIRSGQVVALDALTDTATAREAEARGAELFAAAIDSVHRATDRRAARAREVVGAFRFDPASFELVEEGQALMASFFAPGSGPRAGGYALALGDAELGRPAWLTALADTRPGEADSLRLAWRDSTYDVVATVRPDGDRALVEVVRGASRWAVAEVPTPVRRLFRMEPGPRGGIVREAMSRAFAPWMADGGVNPATHRGRRWPRARVARTS